MTAKLIQAFCLALCLLAPGDASFAEAPDIAAKAQDYQRARQGWDRDIAPQGLPPEGRSGAAPGLRASPAGRVAGRLRQVDFTLTDGIGFFVKDLAVTLEPREPGAPVNFDKIDSFVIRLRQGEVVMRGEALAALFNRHVLDYAERPLDGMRVSTSEGRLETEAGLRLWPSLRGVELPASFAGTVTVTEDNRLYFRIDEVETLGLPVGGVLRALGITLPRLIALERDGVSLRDFGLLLDHRAMFPPPELAGTIAAARLDADGLHLRFADAAPLTFSEPPGLGESYIWLQSGDPKLFGAVVTNARIAIVPAAGSGSLRFDLYDYRNRLSNAAGHLAEDGLITLTVGK